MPKEKLSTKELLAEIEQILGLNDPVEVPERMLSLEQLLTEIARILGSRVSRRS